MKRSLAHVCVVLAALAYAASASAHAELSPSVVLKEHSISFLGRPDSSQTYTFAVRQTYSDGSVVDWSGAESSDAPAPTVEAKDSFGGGNSLVSVIALVVGGLALALAVAALVAGTGRRSPA